jgi:mono/diheme cytochrome c family protein
MKKYGQLFLSSLIIVFASSCDYNKTDNAVPEITASDQKQMDEGKGVGEIKHVTLKEPLESDRVSRGFAIYEMRCQGCHALDSTKVVGPGWMGVTKRHEPEWIMNMILNVDIMLENDPAAQQLLDEHHTRMPDPNISIGDARDLLEFMRSLDVSAL